ncbi:condensin complex subunit 2-domain-containing protein [Lactarius pseudohatsudake]|nr:condensin complex subunit 2-domain-containing protein [Lactarius pseudohatsudake]
MMETLGGYRSRLLTLTTIPQRSVGEERVRRTPMSKNAEAGPSASGAQDDPEDGTGHAHSRHKQALKSIIVETPIIDVPIDVRNSNYEEWMKMAMDNKINQVNSWNFALIDYFHDMSLLRNNVDNSCQLLTSLPHHRRRQSCLKP